MKRRGIKEGMKEQERGLVRNKGLEGHDEGHDEGLFCKQRATPFGVGWGLVTGI